MALRRQYLSAGLNDLTECARLYHFRRYSRRPGFLFGEYDPVAVSFFMPVFSGRMVAPAVVTGFMVCVVAACAQQEHAQNSCIYSLLHFTNAVQ